MKVLLAMDGSEASELALRALIAMGHPQDMEVRIMYVVEIWDVHVRTAQWDRERSVAGREMWARAQGTVARAARILEHAGFRVTTTIEEGDPRTELIDAASEWRADLIMLGSHGRTGLDRLLIGSVSEAVARHAPCSVQIVRLPKEEPLHVRSNESVKDVGNPEYKIPTPMREPEQHNQLCKVCGKPSSSNICPPVQIRSAPKPLPGKRERTKAKSKSER